MQKGDAEWLDWANTTFSAELQVSYKAVQEIVNANPVVVTIVGQNVEAARKKYASLADGSFQAGLKTRLDAADAVDRVKAAADRLIRLHRAA